MSNHATHLPLRINNNLPSNQIYPAFSTASFIDSFDISRITTQITAILIIIYSSHRSFRVQREQILEYNNSLVWLLNFSLLSLTWWWSILRKGCILPLLIKIFWVINLTANTIKIIQKNKNNFQFIIPINYLSYNLIFSLYFYFRKYTKILWYVV